MPTVFYYNGYRFFFWSNEGNEPIHIHVEKDDKAAKYWIDPIVVIAYNEGFTNKELRNIRRQIIKNLQKIRKDWHGHFN